jgi:hypothetical protein
VDVADVLGVRPSADDGSCPTRVKAAIELGTFYGLRLAGRMQLGLQYHLTFEAALQRYARRFPPPPRDEERDDD